MIEKTCKESKEAHIISGTEDWQPRRRAETETFASVISSVWLNGAFDAFLCLCNF